MLSCLGSFAPAALSLPRRLRPGATFCGRHILLGELVGLAVLCTRRSSGSSRSFWLGVRSWLVSLRVTSLVPAARTRLPL